MLLWKCKLCLCLSISLTVLWTASLPLTFYHFNLLSVLSVAISCYFLLFFLLAFLLYYIVCRRDWQKSLFDRGGELHKIGSLAHNILKTQCMYVLTIHQGIHVSFQNVICSMQQLQCSTYRAFPNKRFNNELLWIKTKNSSIWNFK